MLTLNVILGYQGPSYSRLLVICFYVFFFTIRPTDPISGNAFDAKRKQKKGGMALLPSKNLGCPTLVVQWVPMSIYIFFSFLCINLRRSSIN